MSDTSSNSEWDFFFGRGGGSNQKRQLSKANGLVHDLAGRYSYCRQTEKRLFAKNEVYDTVIRNGGTFFLLANKEFIDVTKDFDDTINRIMQSFRDINKSCRTSAQTISTNNIHVNVNTKKAPSFKHKQPSTILFPTTHTRDTNIHNKSLQYTSVRTKTKRVPSIKKSPRPKRRCIRPSIIEPPVIECVRDALRVVDTDKNIPNGKTQRKTLITIGGEINTLCDDGESRNKFLEEERGSSIHQLAVDVDDAFDERVVEPPKLDNSFSQLIMTDEIKAYLPTDSQQSVNLNLHSRVQRLENLVAMLMQQKNDEMELLLK